MAEHAVIVRFDYGSKDLAPLFEVEEQLEAAVEAAGAGEYDGNEIAVDGSDGFLYLYGPDADRLYAAIEDVLGGATCLKNAVATLRYGPPEDGVPQVQVKVGERRKPS